MDGNSIGKALVFTCFGESHGVCVGAVLDGCPAGLQLAQSDVQDEVDRRRPGLTSISTPRREKDHVEILSGVYEGHTTGAPICMIIKNQDVDSSSYEQVRVKPRPGHADYTAYVKYGGYNDWRGGGRFSGRITAAYVMAGVVAKKLLGQIGIEVLAHTVQIGRIRVSELVSAERIRNFVYENPVRCAVSEIAATMEKKILEAAKEGDSVGGIIEGIALNVPVGLGEPVFDSLDAEIARTIFSIPAVKGVEFGAGFGVASMKGSEDNDQYALEKGKVITLSNNAGGILGGISLGMPIVVRVAFKPTPSISKAQRTVDLKTMQQTELELSGRHDPCVVPRAVPVVEACLALVLADHALRTERIPKVLKINK